jgi:uncharacterized repeat protein (TIGR01451 family)
LAVTNDCSERPAPGPVCGNQIKEGSEQCDDGNNNSGDGCSVNCQLEGGPVPICILQGNCNPGPGPIPTPTPAPASTPTVLGAAGQPVLNISKSVSQSVVNPGDKDIEFKIIVRNTGNLSAINTVITDELPAGLEYEDATGQTRSWPIGDLAVGATKEIKYLAKISGQAKPQIYNTVASVQADNFDKVSASADVDVREVKVLAATGFSLKELALLLLLTGALFSASFIIRRRLATR